MSVREDSRGIHRFLGADRASGSPFDLLGVPPTEVTPAAVIAALEARLAELDDHAECRTPAADEVRLALHATAAQLLDPAARASLIETWGSSSVGAWESFSAVPAAMRSLGTPGRIALEGDAVLAMAMEGGWNARSLQRLLMFAHARNMTATDVAAAVRHLSRPAASPPRAQPASPAPTSPSTPRGPGFARGAEAALVPSATASPAPPLRPTTFELTPEEIRAQSAARLRIVFGVVGCGTFVLFAAALGILAALRTKPEDPIVPTVPGPIATTPKDSTVEKPKVEPKRPNDVSKDVTAADAVTRQLAAATDRLREDINDAGTQFDSAMRHASTSWPRWGPDELAAVQNAVIDYLYRGEHEPAALRNAARVLADPLKAVSAGGTVAPESVIPVLWSAGILSRVVRERDLPAAIGGPARLSLASLLGSDADLGDGTFAAGVSRGVAALAPRLAVSPNPETWRQWLIGVGVVSADAPSRGRLVAASIDSLLLNHPDPLKNPGAMDSIAVLTTALTWRSDEQTRAWVFRWFDASEISTPALHAMTSALAAKSSAEGIDPSMVLSAVASAGERAALRGRYAAAWSDAPGGARSEVLTAWLQASDEVMAASSAQNVASGDLRPHVAALVRAITMSRLSEAAAWIAVGDTSKAAAVTADPGGPAKAGASFERVKTDPLGGDNDGAWAVRYLSLLSDGPKRLEMLKQAFAADALTALECEVVASEGIRGLPATVRREARTIIIRHKNLPAMINAILGLAPVLPPTPETISLIEEVTGAKIPPLRDTRWREAARRSLVERLLELAAGRGEFGVVDTLATLLGESYRNRLAAFGGADGLPSQFDGTTLLRLAQTYRERWDKEAERIPPTGKEPATLGQIRQRAAGRAGVASNVVQRFVAEQAASVELMAYVTAAGDASLAEKVGAVIQQWESSRRTAKHIFEQIQASESAMLGLWRLRTQGARA